MHLTGFAIENVLLEFHYYTNLVGGGRNFSAYDTLKGLPPFLKLNLVLKAVAAFFSEINPVWGKCPNILACPKNMCFFDVSQNSDQ